MTIWFLSSTTVACRATSSTSFLNTKMLLSSLGAFSWGCCVFGDGEAGADVLWVGAVVVRKRKMSNGASQRSFGRCIVSRFGENPERRQSFGRNQFHFYL